MKLYNQRDGGKRNWLFSRRISVLFIWAFGMNCQLCFADNSPGLINNHIQIFNDITNGFEEVVAVGSRYNPYVQLTIRALKRENQYVTNYSSPNEATNRINTNTSGLAFFSYFGPTNSFWGPIQLRDYEGRSVPMLRTDVNANDAYPQSYSLSRMHEILMRQYLRYSGGLLPRPIEMIPSFYLKDYFDISKPGLYKLTIWPKIYRRSATNADVCVRVDLSPVTVSMKL